MVLTSLELLIGQLDVIGCVVLFVFVCDFLLKIDKKKNGTSCFALNSFSKAASLAFSESMFLKCSSFS